MDKWPPLSYTAMVIAVTVLIVWAFYQYVILAVEALS